jgi:serine/threonine protein kinase
MSLSDGTRLGPYSILSTLGAGGMGEVCRATDSPLKRQVAVKIFYRSFGATGGVYSAAISSHSPFRVETPRRLIDLNTNAYDSTSPIRSWNVSPDGQRFLASRFERTGAPTTTLNIVLNWSEELRRLVPGK